MIINLINTQLKVMEAQATIMSEATESDMKTAVYFAGKAAGFRLLNDASLEKTVVSRDYAQAFAIQHRNDPTDPLKYQYFEGIAAASCEVLGLRISHKSGTHRHVFRETDH